MQILFGDSIALVRRCQQVYQDVLPIQSTIRHKPEHQSFQDDEDPITKSQNRNVKKKYQNISRYLHISTILIFLWKD
jgi:hypothetical protein